MKHRKVLTFLGFMIFVLAALNFLALAKSIFDIGSFYGWTGAQKGNLFSAGGIGFILGALVSGYLSESFGKKQIILVGLILSGMGNFLFGYLPHFNFSYLYYFFLVFSFLIGMGNGTLEGLTNALIIHLHPEKKSLYLNLAHAFFAVGAVIGPLISGYLMDVFNWQWIFYFNGTVSLFLLLSFLFQRCPSFKDEQKIKLGVVTKLLRNKAFLLLNLCMLLYVGAEVGLVSWVVEYLRTNINFRLSQLQSGTLLSYFWMGMLVGRFGYGWWVEKTSPCLALVISSLGGSVCILLFLITKNLTLATFFIILYGAFLSGMFATIVSLAGHRFPRYIGVVTGVMGGSTGISAAIFPNIIGRISDVRSLSVGIGTCALYLMGVLSIALIMSKMKNSQQAAHLRPKGLCSAGL